MDAFGAKKFVQPNLSFQVCAEFYYMDNGQDAGDFIGVYFRQVRFAENAQGDVIPVVGIEQTKMTLQPLSDGSRFARWGAYRP